MGIRKHMALLQIIPYLGLELACGVCAQYTGVNAWVPASFETPGVLPAWLKKLGRKKRPTDAARAEAKPRFRQVRTNSRS